MKASGRSPRQRLLALALCAVPGTLGCGLLTPTPLEPKAKPTRREEATPGEVRPAPTEKRYAGEWTRASDQARFRVEDREGVVRGNLIKGSRTAGEEEFYAFYTFELRREGGGLRGRASFALADFPADTYQSAWELRLHKGTIQGRAEALSLDEEGEVRERTFEPCLFVVEAPARAADAGLRGELEARGDEAWISAHPAIQALLQGVARSKSKHAALRVKAVAEDAEARLKW